MSELGTDARSLIEAGRASDGPDAHAKARVRERLVQKLGVGAFASAGMVTMVRSASSVPAAHAAPGAGSAAKLGPTLWTKALVKVAAVVAAGGAAYSAAVLVRQPESPAPVAAPAVQAPAPVEVAHEPVPIVEPLAQTQPAATPAVDEAASASERASRSSRREQRRRTRAAASGSLNQELTLLARAERALREGRAAEALEIVREHTKEFPRGALREERRGIEALARCRLGEPDAPSVRAFLRRSSSSPLAARVRKECGR